MNVAEHYRTTLDELTRDRAAGVDLSAAIAGGRRRRRVRRTAWGGAGLAVAAVAAVAGVSLAGGSSSVAVDPGPSGSPSYRDFVGGTSVDETLQATVARHLPDIPAATDVYPSDWNTPGPIPDAAFADATEWHAVYDLSGVERLTLVMSDRIPGEAMVPRCDQIQESDVPCRSTTGADGSRDVTSGYVLHGSTYRFLTVHVSADGFLTETLDDVQAQSWAEARGARTLSDAETAALVSDPALTFPAPVHAPPSPAPQA
jgi:hypothetical protein